MLRAFVVAPVLAATLVGAVTMNRLPVVSAQDATPAAECHEHDAGREQGDGGRVSPGAFWWR